MLQRFGVFSADRQQIIVTYTANAVDLYAYETAQAVIHADMPPWVDPASCKLISIAGIWHGVTPVEYAVAAAVSFGQRLLIKFAAENVLLGITQRGMTSSVRHILADVVQCLQTGSLYDAMDQIRSIPSGSKDPVIITDARLLVCINLIESYIGMNLSTHL